jgi:hypothetical protein
MNPQWKDQIVMPDPSFHATTISWLAGLKEAKVFMDYWLSKDFMKILADKVGEYVLAPGVFPPIDGIGEVKVIPIRELSDQEPRK